MRLWPKRVGRYTRLLDCSTMPNGGGLSAEEFDARERPLRHIDGVLQKFADRKGAQLIRNYHGSPDRHIQWQDEQGITKAILLSPVQKYRAQIGNVERSTAYNVSVIAHKDYPDPDRIDPLDPPNPARRRKWCDKQISELSEFPDDGPALLQMLESAYSELKNIGESHLVTAY
jgi:hypothetical protein